MRETMYQFSENGGVATVCVGVQGTASGCVIPFPISMTLATSHGTGTQCVVIYIIVSSMIEYHRHLQRVLMTIPL